MAEILEKDKANDPQDQKNGIDTGSEVYLLNPLDRDVNGERNPGHSDAALDKARQKTHAGLSDFLILKSEWPFRKQDDSEDHRQGTNQGFQLVQIKSYKDIQAPREAQQAEQEYISNRWE